ncbi:hypothetical protein YC2023_021809 [Brassica napus]
MELTVWKDGMEYRQSYSREKPITTLTCSKFAVASRGTKDTSIGFGQTKKGNLANFSLFLSGKVPPSLMSLDELAVSLVIGLKP